MFEDTGCFPGRDAFIEMLRKHGLMVRIKRRSRFADTLAPEMDKLKAEAAKWATQEEDVLTYAMFPQVAPKFFDKRNAKKQGVDGDHVDYTNQSHPV